MDDQDLNHQQLDLVSNLTSSQLANIDKLLLSNCWSQWRKVALVVGTSMMADEHRIEGVPDVFYAQRVAGLVEKGALLSQGDLKRMRFSEVKLA